MSDPTASIDDLLRAPEETPARRRRPRTGALWWVRAVLLAAAGTAVIVFGLRLVGINIAAPVIVAALLALQLLRRLTSQVAAPSGIGGSGTHPPRTEQTDERDALRSSVNRWEVRLSWSKGDQDRFRRTAWPAIGEIVDERLRQRYGLTRASDPQRARALLGEPVWSFLSKPPTRTPVPRELAAIVAELEKL